MATPVSGVDTWLTLNGQPLCFGEQEENVAASVQEYRPNFLRRCSGAPYELVIRAEGENEPLHSERYGEWIWRPQDYAGLYQLHVDASDLPRHTAWVRVRPGKLSRERYSVMIQDISDVAFDLLYQLYSPAREHIKATKERGQTSAFADFRKVKGVFERMERALALMQRMPHAQLRRVTEVYQLNEIGRHAGEATPIPGPVTHGRRDMMGVRAMLPAYYDAPQETFTYDVYENRLVKFFITRQLRTKLLDIQQRAAKELQRLEQELKYHLSKGWDADVLPKNINSLREVLAETTEMAKRCQTLGNAAFLQGVGVLGLAPRPTQVLQKHPAYSQFYALLLQFNHDLALTLDHETYLTTVTMKKMSGIYEVWAVFQVTEVILQLLAEAGYDLVSQSGFFTIDTNRFVFDVQRNTANIELARDELSVRIRYDPIYPKGSANFGLIANSNEQLTPDLAVEVWDTKAKQPVTVIIFDAKYRWEYDESNDQFQPKSEDLDKMRRYRDLIRYRVFDARNPNRKPAKIVASAYILYPGKYLDHDPEDPEIGALPLVPETDYTLTDQRDTAIADILEAAQVI